MSLYYESGKSKGYLNVPFILSQAEKNNCYIILGVGGRGTGKTYGGLLECEKRNQPFIYMRRKQKHIELACRPELSPFKKLNSDLHNCFQCVKIPGTDVAGIYEGEFDENGKFIPAGMSKGYMISLATFHDTRSVDFSDVNFIFYDEFIPEKRERIMTDEGYTFNNVYETVNRNRELYGQKPVTAFCMANSEKLDNALFMYYGLVKKALKMREQGNEVLFVRDKGIMIVDMVNSPISKAKSETYLYGKANKGTRFSDMAVKNQYDMDGAVPVGKKPLAQYNPVVSMGELTVYRHKSKQEYYISYHLSGNPEHYEITAYDMARLRKKYMWLYYMAVKGLVTFEDYPAYILFDNYYRFK